MMGLLTAKRLVGASLVLPYDARRTVRFIHAWYADGVPVAMSFDLFVYRTVILSANKRHCKEFTDEGSTRDYPTLWPVGVERTMGKGRKAAAARARARRVRLKSRYSGLNQRMTYTLRMVSSTSQRPS